MAGLVRPRRERMLAGVLAGLARRFGMRPTTARILFLVSCLLPGPQFIAYIVLWIVMPSEEIDAP
ncbi:MAG: PspC domain-containing protein [Actinomycetota bacterium]|jgi:phage shock protein PspC (stress-responsive transcriptional regulator)|nr:PspC domain-containing protein [Actinomycetota bacterium]